jgi:hypothetical protein
MTRSRKKRPANAFLFESFNDPPFVLERPEVPRLAALGTPCGRLAILNRKNTLDQLEPSNCLQSPARHEQIVGVRFA